MHYSILNENTTESVRKDVTDIVLNYLAKKRAHQASGNLDGEESVSYLLNELRYRGFRVGGTLQDFEDFMVSLGFTVREHIAGRAVRRYIGV